MPESLFRVPEKAEIKEHVDGLLQDYEKGTLKAKRVKSIDELDANVEDAGTWLSQIEKSNRILGRKGRNTNEQKVLEARGKIAEAVGHLKQAYIRVAPRLVYPLVSSYVANHAHLEPDKLVKNVQILFQVSADAINNHFYDVSKPKKAWRDDWENPYIKHVFEVAKTHADRGAELHELIPALRHDSVEDTTTTVRDLKKAYDHLGPGNFSISHVVSLLSKPIIRMDSSAPLVRTDRGDMVRIVYPEDGDYKLPETPRDKKLRKKNRPFMNRLHIARIWPETGLPLGRQFDSSGQRSEHLVAMNIRLEDVHNNLKSFEGKLKAKERELGRKLSDGEVTAILEPFVRERKEWIPLYFRFNPTFFWDLNPKIRDIYDGLANGTTTKRKTQNNHSSKISPGYVSPTPPSDPRELMKPDTIEGVPHASELEPNRHYVLTKGKINRTQMEALFPEDLIFGHKPQFERGELKQWLYTELLRHMMQKVPDGMSPQKITELVQPTLSILYRNDPHQFIGHCLDLRLFKVKDRHPVYDAIVNATAAAMAHMPISRIPEELRRKLFRYQFRNGAKVQNAPHFGQQSYFLLLPHDIFTGSGQEISDKFKHYGGKGNMTFEPFNSSHESPTFHRFVVKIPDADIQQKALNLKLQEPAHTPEDVREKAVQKILHDLSNYLGGKGKPESG